MSVNHMRFSFNLSFSWHLLNGNSSELCSVKLQYRIQDFPEGVPTRKEGANLLFGIHFVKELHENEKNWTTPSPP